MGAVFLQGCPAVLYDAAMRSAASSSDHTTCRIYVRAGVFSLGGGVLLALCLLFSALTVTVRSLPDVSFGSVFGSGLLCVIAWIYLLKGCREELLYRTGRLVHVSWTGRMRELSLTGVVTVALIHQGLNLEPGMETLEIRYEHGSVERLALGPCWQRNKLESFFRSLEEILNRRDFFEEVR